MPNKKNQFRSPRRDFLQKGVLGGVAAAFAPVAWAADTTKPATDSWKGKSVLITGATSGLGEHMALEFSKLGAKVSICGRRRDKGDAVVKKLNAAGGDARFFKADVQREDEVRKFVRGAAEAFGRIDVAINNAGIIHTSKDFSKDTLEKHIQVITTNLIGTMNCLKYEIEQMLKQGGGSIVNIASVAGSHGHESAPAYAASKHGVLGLTRSFAKRYGKSKIRVNAVSPFVLNWEMGGGGFTDEKSPENKDTLAQIPLGRLVTMTDVMQTVMYLGSDASAIVNGRDVVLDGGAHA